MGLIVFFAGCLWFSFPTSGATTNRFQLVEPPFFHRIWQTEDGLPNPAVRAVAQDREGYLLVATDMGLAQFDGTTFREVERKVSPEKAHRWFTGLLQSKDGSVWASAIEGGLLHYADGALTRYTTTNSALPDDYVLHLYEDFKTNLWIGTAGGLSRFSNREFINYTNQPGLIVEATRSIIEDQNGHLWIGTAKGLSRFDGSQFVSYADDLLLNSSIYCLHADPRGGLWIGTAGGLTHLLNGSVQHYTEQDGLAHTAVRAVLEDSSGQVWIGSHGGLQLFSNGRIEPLRMHSVADPEFKINSIVYSLFEDSEGSLWVGTSFGLNQLRPQPITVYSTEQGLPVEVITSICQGADGVTWIGTYGGGLCRIENEQLVTFTKDDGLPSNHLLALCVDPSGTLWIGTDGRGLSRFRSGRFVNYVFEDDPRVNVIRVIAMDSRGQLWLGSNAGVNRFREGQMVKHPFLTASTVKSIDEDDKGALWFASDSSLIRLKNNSITNLRETLGFTSHTANAIYAGRENDYYVGTDSGLFCFWDGRFHHVQSHPDLERRRILHVLEDDAENLWLSTQTGILSIPKRELLAYLAGAATTFSLSSFGKPEGMRRAQCNGVGQPIAWKMQDGGIWFATMNGVVVVNAKHFQRNTRPPPVKIHGLTVDGQPTPMSEKMKLPPGKGNLEFAYTALSLQSPEKVRFQYQLEGIDNDWVDAANRRLARYSHLPPGQYYFHVRASNSDGIWNEAGSSFQFTLRKHFYQTFWFAAVGALTAISIVSLVVLGRMRAAHHRELELQREINRHTANLQKSLKTMESFNYSIAHDLRGPLRGISGWTTALLHDYSSAFDDTARLYAQRITESVGRMDNLIADLLAFGSISHKEVVAGNIDLDALLSKVLDGLKEEITRKNAVIDAQRPLGSVWANETLLHQVFQNLVSNGLKFVAPGARPELRIWTENSDSKTRISFSDKGIGIPAQHLERIFGVFERLPSATGYPGTGIGLAIVTKAVERMDGALGVSSEPGVGSCFWIELPQSKASAADGRPARQFPGEELLPHARGTRNGPRPVPSVAAGGTHQDCENPRPTSSLHSNRCA
jgi:ligand-binding sensor domain-containing protein/signal transduction histidine kinase